MKSLAGTENEFEIEMKIKEKGKTSKALKRKFH